MAVIVDLAELYPGLDENYAATIGTSADPHLFTAGTPKLAMYATCSSTSGSTSAESFYWKTVMTGAAGVGGRARFHMTTNVALGGWSNALKAHVEYGASGSTSGLGSAFCGEIALSAGTSVGTYAALEAEIVMASGALTGTKTAFMYAAVSGADKGTFDDNGLFLKLDGVTKGAGHLFDDCTAAAASHALKIDIAGTLYYIMLNSNVDA